MLTLKQNTIACEAIKELVEVTLRSRKDTKRKEMERAIARELRRQKLPKNYTGEIKYHDYTIRIQRRTIIQFMTDEK
jgi:phosphopentomutase